MLLCVAVFCIQAAAQTQNRYEEIVPAGVRNGNMVLGVTVAGAAYDFALDPSRASTVVVAGTPGLSVESGKAVLEKLEVAENLFVNRITADVVEDGALAEIGIAGILGRDVLKDAILTIDRQEGYVTLSAPYKPAYMTLRNRTDLSAAGSCQTVLFGGEKITAPLDSLLALGVLSFDFPRRKVYFEKHGSLVKPVNPVSTTIRGSVEEGAVINLDREAFLREVFDFRNNDEWKYQGELPCVIDLWATWCAPCLKLSPTIDALAEEYEGRVKFYKVNVDEEKEIAAGYFNVVAIPLLIFIPMEGPPVKVLASSREEIVAKIEELFVD